MAIKPIDTLEHEQLKFLLESEKQLAGFFDRAYTLHLYNTANTIMSWQDYLRAQHKAIRRGRVWRNK